MIHVGLVLRYICLGFKKSNAHDALLYENVFQQEMSKYMYGTIYFATQLQYQDSFPLSGGHVRLILRFKTHSFEFIIVEVTKGDSIVVFLVQLKVNSIKLSLVAFGTYLNGAEFDNANESSGWVIL